MQIEKRIGREKKRCGYAPFNSAQQAIKLRSLRSLRPSGKLPSATCFIAGPLYASLTKRYVYEIQTENINSDIFVFRNEILCTRLKSRRINFAIKG